MVCTNRTSHNKKIRKVVNKDISNEDKDMKVWFKPDFDDERIKEATKLVVGDKVIKEGEHWLVRSIKKGKNYVVILDGKVGFCTCPDFERRRKECKHILAVKMVVRKNGHPKGETDIRVTKPTFHQDWTNYNKAQTNEKSLFMKLLSDLLGTIEEDKRDVSVRGRKPFSLKDMAFASALKVYTTYSLRRFMTDINEANDKGYVSQVPYFSVVSVYMNKPEMTQLLQKLVTLSSLPLKNVETKFAVDSTGFRINRFTDYFVEKHRAKREHQWIKAHITCGIKTNVITAVEISDQFSSDGNYFIPLVEKTLDTGFNVLEVSADKAYSSRQNIGYVNSIGGMTFIPFKSNTTGKAKGSLIWKRMYNYYMLQREDFMDHYHLRSNIESTNNMIKSKFTDLVRSKNSLAQYNEILLKVICHNIVVLIQSMFELGIEPGFLDSRAKEN